RRRQRSVRALQRRHSNVLAKAARLEDQIRELGGDPFASGRPGRRGPGRPRGSGGGRRPRNEKNLVEALSGVLNGKTMSVTDVADAVQKAGYKTSAANFRTIVNQTLIKSDRFKRVGRGQYTAK
ncbi:MAG TPA: hypothetical protein VFN82_03220, partial [Solirubrobacterales bacterium]|nr:hypothetical protein [Solirubrobacterales bacterium]